MYFHELLFHFFLKVKSQLNLILENYLEFLVSILSEFPLSGFFPWYQFSWGHKVLL